jgi:Flp pilus assembly pilin Flp
VNLAKRFFIDDDGAELPEYTLIIALVTLATVAGIMNAGAGLIGIWNFLSGLVATTLTGTVP